MIGREQRQPDRNKNDKERKNLGSIVVSTMMHPLHRLGVAIGPQCGWVIFSLPFLCLFLLFFDFVRTFTYI